MGHPVSHSLSPVLHGAALAATALAGSYELVDTPDERLEETIGSLILRGFCGFNVTVPHKTRVANLVGSRSADAIKTGAVNTVLIDADGSLHGENTDVPGFYRSLCERFPAGHRRSVAIIAGYGGAARAVVAALAEFGFETILVCGRSETKAEEFVRELVAAGLSSRQQLNTLASGSAAGADLLVNATPSGQGGKPLEDWLSGLVSRLRPALVFDLVYSRSPLEATPLVAQARELGLSAVDGADMLVYQAAAAFHLWTGVEAPTAVMKSALYPPGG